MLKKMNAQHSQQRLGYHRTKLNVQRTVCTLSTSLAASPSLSPPYVDSYLLAPPHTYFKALSTARTLLLQQIPH